MFFQQKCKRKGIFSRTSARERVFMCFLVAIFQKFSALCAILQHFLNRQDMVLLYFVLICAKFCKKLGIVLTNFVRERVSFS